MPSQQPDGERRRTITRGNDHQPLGGRRARRQSTAVRKRRLTDALCRECGKEVDTNKSNLQSWGPLRNTTAVAPDWRQQTSQRCTWEARTYIDQLCRGAICAVPGVWVPPEQRRVQGGNVARLEPNAPAGGRCGKHGTLNGPVYQHECNGFPCCLLSTDDAGCGCRAAATHNFEVQVREIGMTKLRHTSHQSNDTP